ncbi:MAG: response regulator transcription factor, partial [Caldilineaceae bacterium]|nr:response regulator transcription factor [Caldilineaceae bacterium]
KPFHLDVLLARVKTALRRTASSPAPRVKKALAVGDLRMDPRTFHAAVDERTLDLTPKEFDLLFYLAGRATEVVTVDEIVTHVWGEGWIGETQTVYVHMRWLRTKLETDPAHPERLLTVRGLGYKLMPHAQAVPT